MRKIVGKEPENLYLEGMDLSGKSSVARQVSASMGVSVRQKQMCSDNPFLEKLREVKQYSPVGSDLRSHMFLDAIEYDIENNSEQGGFLIQESTMIVKSMAIDVVARKKRAILARYDELMAKHPKFDLVIMLTVDTPTRISRLEKRVREDPASITENDLLLVSDTARFEMTEQVMKDIIEYDFDGHLLDTTKMSIDEVSCDIIDKL